MHHRPALRTPPRLGSHTIFPRSESATRQLEEGGSQLEEEDVRVVVGMH